MSLKSASKNLIHSWLQAWDVSFLSFIVSRSVVIKMKHEKKFESILMIKEPFEGFSERSSASKSDYKVLNNFLPKKFSVLCSFATRFIIALGILISQESRGSLSWTRKFRSFLSPFFSLFELKLLPAHKINLSVHKRFLFLHSNEKGW